MSRFSLTIVQDFNIQLLSNPKISLSCMWKYLTHTCVSEPFFILEDGSKAVFLLNVLMLHTLTPNYIMSSVITNMYRHLAIPYFTGIKLQVCRFLEVSRLSFSPEYGPKLKEDFIMVKHLPKIQSDDDSQKCCSCQWFGCCKDNWQKVALLSGLFVYVSLVLTFKMARHIYSASQLSICRIISYQQKEPKRAR